MYLWLGSSFISSASPTACALVRTRKWEDSLRESVRSFHRVGLGDWTQVTRHGTKRLYLLNHLTHPFLFVFKVNTVSCSGSALSNVNLIPSICILQRWQRQVDLLRAFMVWDCGAGFGGGLADKKRIEGNQQQGVYTHTCRMWSLIPESFPPRFHKLDGRGKDGLLQIWG